MNTKNQNINNLIDLQHVGLDLFLLCLRYKTALHEGKNTISEIIDEYNRLSLIVERSPKMDKNDANDYFSECFAQAGINQFAYV